MQGTVNYDIDITIMHIISLIILVAGIPVALYLKDANVFITTLTTASLAGGWAEHKQNEYYRENKETPDA